GRVQGVVHKSLLPNYDIFDEYRYFEPAFDWQVMMFKGYRLAVTICEDIWNITDDPLYRFNPMDKLLPQQPQLMINLSASPFDYVHADRRKEIVRQNAVKYQLPVVYCNTVGAQTDLIFDGGSLFAAPYGAIQLEMPYFEEALQSIHWPFETQGATLAANAVTAPAPLHLEAERNIEQIHSALLLGICDYFAKMNFQKAIVASSGGIDSALVLALACEALGPQQVAALLLPSQYSSDHSVNDAVQLSMNLGNHYDIIGIERVFNAYTECLLPVFNGLQFNVAEENLQSRIRGAMVMALANKFGYILLNTSNKSELSTGYGTLYGDMAGGLGVLGDVYKVQVYALARYINRNGEIIPQNILDKAPSAELRPGQKDSDSLPDYALLDAILYQYIELRRGPREIVAQGFDEALVQRVLKLVNTNEYKRNQFCPILRVSPKAFGAGRRVPIVASYL
ncbi:MAG: NAD+ synthase, partial [Chitinophagia bacterium]|nr:NAD+ synthase [Chitinophagia bacterium]